MTLVDNHNHIILAEITKMLAAAKTNNVSEYSITEHISQFREPRESIRFGSIHPDGRIFESLKENNPEFRKIDHEVDYGMTINRGLEVDFSPRFETRVGDFCQPREMGHPSMLRPRIRGRKGHREKRWTHSRPGPSLRALA
jgi:histidinol phosphatase-like PHP family hydrolase